MFTYNTVQTELLAANATSSKEYCLDFEKTFDMSSSDNFTIKLNLSLAASAFAQAERYLSEVSKTLNKEQDEKAC